MIDNICKFKNYCKEMVDMEDEEIEIFINENNDILNKINFEEFNNFMIFQQQFDKYHFLFDDVDPPLTLDETVIKFLNIKNYLKINHADLYNDIFQMLYEYNYQDIEEVKERGYDINIINTPYGDILFKKLTDERIINKIKKFRNHFKDKINNEDKLNKFINNYEYIMAGLNYEDFIKSYKEHKLYKEYMKKVNRRLLFNGFPI